MSWLTRENRSSHINHFQELLKLCRPAKMPLQVGLGADVMGHPQQGLVASAYLNGTVFHRGKRGAKWLLL